MNDTKLEIRRVSTLRRLLDKIEGEMTSPVAIIIDGADCTLKYEITDKIAGALHRSHAHFSEAPTSDTLFWAFAQYDAVIITLTSAQSCVEKLQDELVKVMRNVGAKTVVSIHIKVNKLPFFPLSQALDTIKFNRQLRTIEHNLPDASIMDYFIIIPEKEQKK